jgi:hypothetical protein
LEEKFSKVDLSLEKEQDIVIQNKVDDWKRDKLEREFKVLFFKSREIKYLMEGYK